MGRGLVAVVGAAAALICGIGSPSAGGTSRREARASSIQSGPSHAGELRRVLTSLGDKHGLRILLDPGLIVPAQPASPPKDTTPARALDTLVGAIPGAAWRCVYLQLSPSASLPDASRVADWVRALDRLNQVGMVVENVTNGRATVLMKEYPISKSYRADLTRARYRTVYIVYRAKGAAALNDEPSERPTRPEPGQMAEVLGDMLGAFFSLDEVSQKAGMQQAMGLLFSIDPGSRAEFVTKLWASLSPEQRADLARTVMRIGFDGP